MRKYLGLFLISTLLLYNALCSLSMGPKIAIVGGGIGGASASHYLTELFNGQLSIDLFEAGKLGGRLATVKIAGMEFEAGGAIIHERNLLMKRFLKLLGMEKRKSCRNQRFAIWNKDKFVFEESSYEFMTLAKLVYRYGLQPFRLHGYVNALMDDFAKIYKLQDDGISFANVTDFLLAVNSQTPKMLHTSTKEYLTKLGFSSELIHELVEAALVTNYGQDTNVHSFVGFVGIAGAGSTLWAVKGGNNEIPKHLIYRNSRVNVIPTIVKKVVHLERNTAARQYELYYSNNGSSDTMKTTYDIVIIATPLTNDQAMPIQFQDFPETEKFELPGAYQTVVVNFIHGNLNHEYFDSEEPIDAILSCDPEKTIISCVGNLESTEGNCSKVWKTFSRKPLEQSLIEKMFTQVDHIETKEWKAVPKYSTEQLRLDFKLHDSLYYINAIEWAASAMEMSAIGGRNVAILAHNDYRERNTLKEFLNRDEVSKSGGSSAHSNEL